eukprot:gnl/Chilomastix_caulleri/7296.p2 GENE.gnl/Chilomastix_caulleri/7296~~gnl/Chilomastix_caulleri/7296.p2  ORF type:complete len:56 (+),score=11.64 gnl/Chilomastix_caulleri/7296:7-174(+)
MNFLDLTPQFAALRASLHEGPGAQDMLSDGEISEGLVNPKKRELKKKIHRRNQLG